jgi:uncharacterized tellurite resistance protein B-like protein
LPGDLVSAYIDALVCVAQANGISEPETRMIHALAELMGAMPFVVSNALKGVAGIDLGRTVEALHEHPHLLVTLYRDALLVAGADGVVDEEELAVLDRVAEKLGISQSQRGRAQAAVTMLDQLRETMRAL